MICREHCAHWRVCENINDPAMRDIVNGNEVEIKCSAFMENPVIAQWKTREAKNDYLWVECSNCGFKIENYKAVELGKSSIDVISYKWHACPKCTAKMILSKGV